MASVGGGAAYQKLERLDNQISDNANKAADRAAANMRQQRQINADTKAKKTERDNEQADKNDEVLKQNRAKTSTSTHYKDTGRQNLDEVSSMFFRDAQIELDNKVSEIYKLPYGSDEQVAAQNEFNRMSSDYERFAQTLNVLKTDIQGFKDATEKGGGQVLDSETSAMITAFDKDEGFQIYKDDETGAIIATMNKYDENGDVELDEDGNNKRISVDFDAIKNRDYKAYTLQSGKDMVDSIGVQLGTLEKDEDTGELKYTTKDYNEDSREVVEGEISKITGTVKGADGLSVINPDSPFKPNNREMYKWYYDVYREEKKGDFTDKERRDIGNHIRTKVEARMDKEEKTDASDKKAQEQKDKQLSISQQNATTGRNNSEEAKRANKQKEALAKRKQDWAENPKNKTGTKTKAEAKEEVTKRRNLVEVMNLVDEIAVFAEKNPNYQEGDIQQIFDKYSVTLGDTFDFDLDKKGGMSEYEFGEIDDLTANQRMRNAMAIIKNASLDINSTDIDDYLENFNSDSTTDTSDSTTDTSGGNIGAGDALFQD